MVSGDVSRIRLVIAFVTLTVPGVHPYVFLTGNDVVIPEHVGQTNKHLRCDYLYLS
jgi:hypothetical protein